MTATERPIGAILDDLGVSLELRDQDRITGVLVIAKVVDLDDGETPAALAIGTDEASDWISARGIFESAGDVLRGNPMARDGDD